MGKKSGLKRVVLDTNVLVSALLFTGPSNLLVELWQEGAVILLASGEMVREYVRVFAYPKFKLSEDEALGMLREQVLPFIQAVHVEHAARVVKEDPSDDQFLACAVSGKADAIVSGDKHLLGLGRHQGIAILTVRAFLDRLGRA